MPNSDNLPIRLDNWFALAHDSGGAAMPIPFAKDIFLLASTVVGTGFVDDIGKKTEAIVPGDILALRRDPRNPHDELAIQVLNGGGEPIGFVPRKDNPVLARLMDAGKSIFSKVREILDREEWPRIAIDIYMRDL